LIGESAELVRRGGCAEAVYLEVYQTSGDAMKLYKKFDFVNVIDEPIPDPLQGGLPYFIMAKGVVFSGESSLSTKPMILSSEANYLDPPEAL